MRATYRVIVAEPELQKKNPERERPRSGVCRKLREQKKLNSLFIVFFCIFKLL